MPFARRQGMLRQLMIASLVVLAVSPFSAPFQTCDLLRSDGTEDPSIVVTNASSTTPEERLNLALLVTQAGRLTRRWPQRFVPVHAALVRPTFLLALVSVPSISDPDRDASVLRV